MPQTHAQKTAAAKRKLSNLGRVRKRLDELEEKWKKDAKQAIGEADGLVPKTEMAERLNVHRTTVYELKG